MVKFMVDMNEELKDAVGTMSFLSKETPDQLAAFKAMGAAIEADGALSAKTKELIALGIAIKAQCSYCIAFHVKKSLDMGLSKEEILEAAWVAVLMGGGPAMMYITLVQKALEQYVQ